MSFFMLDARYFLINQKLINFVWKFNLILYVCVSLWLERNLFLQGMEMKNL